MAALSRFLRSLKAVFAAGLGLIVLLSAAPLPVMAATKEPTLSIPKNNPVKPTCVGWGVKEGCADTITAALKNAGNNKTVFVKAGAGVADNLVISKGVTICAANEKNTCIKDLQSTERFRLIRKDASKPCIKIAYGRTPGDVKIRGMEIRDIEKRAICIANTSRHVASYALTFERSVFENVELKLSGFKAVSVSNTRIAHTYDSEELTAWSISKGGTATFNDGVTIDAVDLHINDLELDLAIDRYNYGNVTISGGESSKVSILDYRYGLLTLQGTGSAKLFGSSFRKAGLMVTDAAIRTIRDNYFTETDIVLDHAGLVTFENNVIESAPYISLSAPTAKLQVAAGVNRITGNHFGAECSGLPSDAGSTCGCSGGPSVELSGTNASGVTTKIAGNKVCVASPRWIVSSVGPDETFRGNCAMTRQSKIGKASGSFYRSLKGPLKSQLLVTYVAPGRSARNISPDCIAFMR